MPFERVVEDDRVFERLYSTYSPNVFRYALTVLGQPADAEDVTQTTFMNAYRALQRGERPRKPEHWLIAIAHNACRERFRHTQRRPREVALGDELAAPRSDDATTAEELQQALLQLPPAQRAALVMRELEGRSYAETAAALRISSSALERLLFRARRTLREQLECQVSCSDAAAAITMQLEGDLSPGGRRVLRAHLRTCRECAALARSQRARHGVLRGLLNLPFLPRLGRLFHGASGAGAGIAAKTAAVAVVAAVAGSGVYVSVTQLGPAGAHRRPALASSPAADTERSLVPSRRTLQPMGATPTAALTPTKSSKAAPTPATSDPSAPAAGAAAPSAPATVPSAPAAVIAPAHRASGKSTVHAHAAARAKKANRAAPAPSGRGGTAAAEQGKRAAGAAPKSSPHPASSLARGAAPNSSPHPASPPVAAATTPPSQANGNSNSHGHP